MAYTAPTQLTLGAATKVVSAATTTGAQTPFSFFKGSGQSWANVIFQAVNSSISALVANLEVDESGVDANFVTLVSAMDLKNVPGQVMNLCGGNVRYRFNFTTFTGTSTDIWAITG